MHPPWIDIIACAVIAWPALPDGTRIALPDRIVAEFRTFASDEEGRELDADGGGYQRREIDVSEDSVRCDTWSREGNLPEQYIHLSMASRELNVLLNPQAGQGHMTRDGFPLAFGVGDSHELPTDALRMLGESMRRHPERVEVKRVGAPGEPRVYRVHVPPRRASYEVHIDLEAGTVPRVRYYRDADPERLSGDWEFRDWKPAKGGGLVPTLCIWRSYPTRKSLDPTPYFQVAKLVSARDASREPARADPVFPAGTVFTGGDGTTLYDSKFNVVGEVPAPAQPKPARRWANTALVSAGVVMTALAGWVYARRRRGLS